MQTEVKALNEMKLVNRAILRENEQLRVMLNSKLRFQFIGELMFIGVVSFILGHLMAYL